MLQTITKAVRPLRAISPCLVLLVLALALIAPCLGGCSECDSNGQNCEDVPYFW